MVSSLVTFCCIERHVNMHGRAWCDECGSLVAGTIIGEYRIVSCIGQGSASSVYLAEQHSLGNREVVIKILDRSNAEPDMGIFQHEAALLASLSHPYILPIYAYGVLEEQRALMTIYSPYLVLLYAEQGSLEDIFVQEGQRPWSFERVAGVAKEVAEALDYAHSRGVLHRDVKPANLLQKGSHVLLSDFNVASLIDAEKSHLRAPWAGSPAYMAPEVWAHRPGRYSDQYALAVTCYRLLAGDYPWENSGSGGTHYWSNLHCTETPRSLLASRPDLPATVDVVLQRALAKNPHERYQTVQAFADDLLRAGMSREIGGVGETRTETLDLVDLPTAIIPAIETVETVETVVKASTLGNGEVHTGSIKKGGMQPNDKWIWGALLINLLVCVVLAAVVSWQERAVGAAADVVLALWPSLLLGPIIAPMFRGVIPDSRAWGVFWGIAFGITDALLCIVLCYGWTALALTIPHWGYDWQRSGDGLHIFVGEVQNLAGAALGLAIPGLWLAVLGGAILGLYCGRTQTQRQ